MVRGHRNVQLLFNNKRFAVLVVHSLCVDFAYSGFCGHTMVTVPLYKKTSANNSLRNCNVRKESCKPGCGAS
jgi:hypothetical protein